MLPSAILVASTTVQDRHQLKLRCSIKQGILENFTNFTRKHLCQSLFFNKVADLKPATLLQKRLWCRWFPVNFPKFLRTPYLQNTSGRALLLCPIWLKHFFSFSYDRSGSHHFNYSKKLH